MMQLIFPGVGAGGSMMDYARRMVGSDTMDEEQLRQIREQQEVHEKTFGFPARSDTNRPAALQSHRKKS